MSELDRIIDNLMLKDWTRDEVEFAIMNSNKPFKQITIHDVSESIIAQRKGEMELKKILAQPIDQRPL